MKKNKNTKNKTIRQTRRFEENTNNLPLFHRSINDAKKIKQLIESGADINARNNENFSPLQYAIYNDCLETTLILLENGALIDNLSNNASACPLSLALNSEKNAHKIIRALLEKGADINKKDNHGLTLLHKAAAENAFEKIKILVENGADLSAQNNNGNSPLHFLAEHGPCEALHYLLKAVINSKGNINQTNKLNYPCLYYLLAAKDHRKAMTFIKTYRPDLNIKTANEGMTAILMALKGNKPCEFIDFLVEYGADLNIVDDRHNSALTYAALYSKDAVVLIKKFLGKGAIIATPSENKDPFSLLHIAAYQQNTDLLAYLLDELKLDFNIKSIHNKFNALCYAIEMDKKKSIDYLYAWLKKNKQLTPCSVMVKDAIKSSIFFKNEYALNIFITCNPQIKVVEEFELSNEIFLKTHFIKISELTLPQNDFIHAVKQEDIIEFRINGEGEYFEKNNQRFCRIDVFKLLLMILKMSLISYACSQATEEEGNCYTFKIMSQHTWLSKKKWQSTCNEIKKITPDLILRLVNNRKKDLLLLLKPLKEKTYILNQDATKVNQKIVTTKAFATTVNQSIVATATDSVFTIAEEYKKITDFFENNESLKEPNESIIHIDNTSKHILAELDVLNAFYRNLELKLEDASISFSFADFFQSKKILITCLNRISMLKEENRRIEVDCNNLRITYATIAQNATMKNVQVMEKNSHDQKNELISTEIDNEVDNNTDPIAEEQLQEFNNIICDEDHEEKARQARCETAALKLEKIIDDSRNSAVFNAMLIPLNKLIVYLQESISGRTDNPYLFPAILFNFFKFSDAMHKIVHIHNPCFANSENDNPYKYESSLQYLRDLRNLPRHFNSHGDYADSEVQNHTVLYNSILNFILPFKNYIDNQVRLSTKPVFEEKNHYIDLDLGCFIFNNKQTLPEYLIKYAQKSLPLAFSKLKEIASAFRQSSANELSLLIEAAKMFLLLVKDSTNILKKENQVYKNRLQTLDKQYIVQEMTGLEFFVNHEIAHHSVKRQLPYNSGSPRFNDIMSSIAIYEKFFLEIFELNQAIANHPHVEDKPASLSL